MKIIALMFLSMAFLSSCTNTDTPKSVQNNVSKNTNTSTPTLTTEGAVGVKGETVISSANVGAPTPPVTQGAQR